MIACIVHGLEYIHNNGIIHRDIKPENLVFDSRGYLQITDFGIARIWNPNNENDTSGTPGYMAPEVMLRTKHGVGTDYYAVGIIAYECMMGRVIY
jgi:serine/threonine protein kinase